MKAVASILLPSWIPGAVIGFRLLRLPVACFCWHAVCIYGGKCGGRHKNRRMPSHIVGQCCTQRAPDPGHGLPCPYDDRSS